MSVETTTSSLALKCTVSFPNADLHGLRAIARSVDRRGATLSVTTGFLLGRAVQVEDTVEVDFQLPRNERFGPRAMNCIGSVVRVKGGAPGPTWFIVRFHSLQFRHISPERQGEYSASSRGGMAREQ